MQTTEPTVIRWTEVTATVIKWEKVAPGHYTAQKGPHYFEVFRVSRPQRVRTDHWSIRHTGPNGFADPARRWRFDKKEELWQLPTLRLCKRRAVWVVNQSIGWEDELDLTKDQLKLTKFPC